MSESEKEQQESLHLRRLIGKMIQAAEGASKRQRREAPKYFLYRAGTYPIQIQKYWDDLSIEQQQWLWEEQPDLAKSKSLPLPKSYDPKKFEEEWEEHGIADEPEPGGLNYDGEAVKQRLSEMEAEMDENSVRDIREEGRYVGMCWQDPTEELFKSVYYNNDRNLMLKKQRNQELFEITLEAVQKIGLAKSDAEQLRKELWIEKRKVKELTKLCAEEHAKYRGLLKSNKAMEASVEDEAL